MGISEKLERLRKSLNDTIKFNFDNLADEIAKTKLNIRELSKIAHSFSLTIMILKKKGIITNEDYQNELESDENKKISEQISLESQDTRNLEDNK